MTVQTVPSYNFIYLALSPGAKGNKVKMTKEVREAISLGLDRKEILEFTLGGRDSSSPLRFRSASRAAAAFRQSPTIRPRPRICSPRPMPQPRAGCRFPNLNAYGVDLSLLMQKVQQELSKINVKVNLQPMTFANWREQVSGNRHPADGRVLRARLSIGSAQYVEYFGMMAGSPWAKRAGAANDPSVINPREQELLKKALQPRGEEAAKIYHEIGLEMIKDKVILPLVSPNLILAYNKGVKGVRYSACCNLPVAEISR